MPWQLTAMLYVLLSSTRAIQNRRIGLLKNDLSLYALVASFSSVALVGIVAGVISWSSVDHSAALDAWAYILLGGTLLSALNLLTIKLFRHVPASVAVFMNLFNTISVILFAALFVDESLTSRQWIGSVLLLSAVVWIGLASRHHGVSKRAKKELVIGILLALSAAALFGPAIVNERYVIERIGIETYLLYGWGMQALCAFVIAYALKNRSAKKKKITRAMHTHVWLYGSLLGLGGLFFVLTLNSSGSASITAISGTARIAVTVIMAYVFLKERANLLAKLVGVGISAAGLYLLFT